MTIEQLHHIFLQFPNACTDTRKISENCIFFALKGDNFDGNVYAEEALKKGAAYAVIDNEQYIKSDKFILVDDVLKTLQKLGTLHRNYCKAKIIALTGSNGKTTTKELIFRVLSKKYDTVATQGNLNNHIGVPLTLLTIKSDTEICVVEMGANHQKEIEFLCSLSEPDFGYITNYGKAHLEGFGGVEGVIKGKSELYDYLTSNDRYVFLNADDPIQNEKLGSYIKKFGYSTNNHQYYVINFLEADPFVKIKVENTTIESQLIGAYNFTNCCAAIVMGKYFNVPIEDIKNAIETYEPENNRSQILEKEGYKIVMDAYNANPTSMKVALENFSSMDESKKVVFLGDMFELGETAEIEHQNIVDLASRLNFDTVFLIGENFYQTDTSFTKFKSYQSAEESIKKNGITENSTILIKGSRGMALERLLEVL